MSKVRTSTVASFELSPEGSKEVQNRRQRDYQQDDGFQFIRCLI